MKGARLSVVLALSILTAGCGDLGEPSADDVVNCRGTIIQTSPATYLIESDVTVQKNATTYYPLNLPGAFKRNGLRIRFSGRLEVDPTAQYLYAPLRLSRIEAIER